MPAAPQIVFIHIEKTAGTAILRGLIRPNVPDNARSKSIREYIQHARQAPVFSGHIPYGLHAFAGRPVQYFTVLRDPLDRAVSWYYYIRDQEDLDLWPRHPLRNFADSVTLTEFYDDPRFGDRQARFLAGISYDRLYPRLRHVPAFRRKLVDAAKRHLDACVCFGIQDRFQESIDYIRETFGWSVWEPEQARDAAKTVKRRSVREIADLKPAAIERLKATHALDDELWAYAKQQFDARMQQRVGVPRVGWDEWVNG